MKFIIVFLGISSIILAITSSTPVDSEKVRYDGFKVYKIKFTNDEQFDYLYNMKINSIEVDFWQLSRAEKYADIMVGPERASAFLDDIKKHGLTYEVLIEDVQKTIDNPENQ